MSKSKEKEIIGNLIGVTRPDIIEVLIDPKITRNNPLEIGEYVAVDYPGEVLEYEVLALITQITLQNENIPDSLMRSPDSYEQLKKLGDFTEGERLTAIARIVGYYDPDKENVIFPRFPPVPSGRVYRANKDNLAKIFSSGQVKIGHLRAHPDVDVKVDVEELIRRHTAILAITGAGKGNTVAVISSRILELNGSIIIIDPHDEYHYLRNLYSDPNPVIVFNPGGDPSKQYFPLYFRWNNFSIEEIFDIFEIRETATNQRALVREVLTKLNGKNWDINNFEQVMNRFIFGDETLNEEERKEYQKQTKKYVNVGLALRDHIKGIREMVIIDKFNETPIFEKSTKSLVSMGQITVISLSGLPKRVQQVVVSRLCRKLYNAGVSWRRNLDRPQLPCPTFMILEEAHNFIPALDKVKSSKPIERIAAEGRKFGIGLCIVSQRPNKIDQNVLSQCNSQIILKIVNPRDQSHIENSAEAISTDLMNDLPSLNIGEAVILGSCILLPALVKIDKFWGELGGDDIEIINIWQGNVGKDKKSKIKMEDREDTLNYKDKGPLI